MNSDNQVLSGLLDSYLPGEYATICCVGASRLIVAHTMHDLRRGNVDSEFCQRCAPDHFFRIKLSSNQNQCWSVYQDPLTARMTEELKLSLQKNSTKHNAKQCARGAIRRAAEPSLGVGGTTQRKKVNRKSRLACHTRSSLSRAISWFFLVLFFGSVHPLTCVRKALARSPLELLPWFLVIVTL